MKSVQFEKYGDANVLKLVNIDVPEVKRKNSLLLKVKYSSLNAIDYKNRAGRFRVLSGLVKPRTKQGFDVLGEIIGISKDVKNFKVNDLVLGQFGNFDGGAFSEYVVISTENAVCIAKQISLEQLAGLPMAGTTAWQALFEIGKIEKDQEILINGGSSGVGHLAIQLAKSVGAKVTSVSSSRNLEFCKKIGADYVINYETEDFTKLNKEYDLIFDVVNNRSFKSVNRVLSKTGKYIGTTPTFRLIKDIIFSKRAHFVAVRPDKAILIDLIKKMTNNSLKVYIEKTYSIDNIIEAHKHIESNRVRGKIIVKVEI